MGEVPAGIAKAQVSVSPGGTESMHADGSGEVSSDSIVHGFLGHTKDFTDSSE